MQGTAIYDWTFSAHLVKDVQPAGRLDVKAGVVERGQEAAEHDEDQHRERVHAGGRARGDEVDGQQMVVLAERMGKKKTLKESGE